MAHPRHLAHFLIAAVMALCVKDDQIQTLIGFTGIVDTDHRDVIVSSGAGRVECRHFDVVKRERVSLRHGIGHICRFISQKLFCVPTFFCQSII